MPLMDTEDPDINIVSNFEINLVRPKGWRDHSAYNFEAPKPDPESKLAANANITRANLPLGLSYDAFIKAEYADYKNGLDGFELIHHRKGQVNKFQATELAFTWMMDEHKIRQRVVYLKSGLKKVITFSAVAAEADYPNQEPFFNQILASVKV